MIDLDAARLGLADVAGTVPGIERVYPRAVDGSIELPAVVIGLPEVEFDVAPCQTDTATIPVAVAVRRMGANEEAVQQQLEDLWVAVATAIRGSLETGPLSNVGEGQCTRAVMGSLDIAGQSWPAYVIEVEFTG